MRTPDLWRLQSPAKAEKRLREAVCSEASSPGPRVTPESKPPSTPGPEIGPAGAAEQVL